jgi:hypothetical protein
MRKLLLFFCLICIGFSLLKGKQLTDAKSVIPDKVDPYVLQPQYDMSKLKDIIPCTTLQRLHLFSVHRMWCTDE